jgi:hypothetical protein
VELVIDAGDESDEDLDSAAVEEAVVEAQEIQDDDGQIAHDDAVVKSLPDVAIQEMAKKNVVMTDAENWMALKIFPAV